MSAHWTPGEIDRYLDSYARSNDFVRDCISAVHVSDAWPGILDSIVLQYGADVLADAADDPEWMIGSPWKANGEHGLSADVILLDDYRTSNDDGPPAA
tara:strand:- start:3808 stop:4101 length:294 start_codon:yes stop_codon:yes gene_type:complete